MTANLPVEDDFVLANFLVWCVPFLAFFLGIIIRKQVFPGPKSPPLGKQLLMGIPVSLVIVSSLLAGIYEGIREHVPAYIFTLGVLMEHGMLVSETLVHQLEKLRGMATTETQVAQPVGGSLAKIG